LDKGKGKGTQVQLQLQNRAFNFNGTTEKRLSQLFVKTGLERNLGALICTETKT